MSKQIKNKYMLLGLEQEIAKINPDAATTIFDILSVAISDDQTVVIAYEDILRTIVSDILKK